MSNTATFNTSPNLKLSKKLSFGEEVANSVTHAVGAVAMLVLLPITAVHANNGYGMTAAVGMSVFVISLFLMFLSSAMIPRLVVTICDLLTDIFNLGKVTSTFWAVPHDTSCFKFEFSCFKKYHALLLSNVVQ